MTLNRRGSIVCRGALISYLLGCDGGVIELAKVCERRLRSVCVVLGLARPLSAPAPHILIITATFSYTIFADFPRAATLLHLSYSP